METRNGNSEPVAKSDARLSSSSPVQRYFEVSLLLMLAVGFTTVATTGRLDLLSIALVLPALVLKLSSYMRGVDYSLSPRAVTRLSLAYLPFLLIDFAILAPGPGALDRMLQAAVHLVLFTAVVKAFSTRSPRDYAYLASLSFLMMLAGAILTVSTAYLAEFVAYVSCAISTFISYEIKRAGESLPRLRPAPPDSARQDRTQIEQSLAGTTALLAFGIVGLAAILFFAIPRYRTGYLGEFGTQTENITGFSEKVDLGDIRKIKESSLVVMRVLPEGGGREFQGIKWRGVALTSFDGRRWFNDNTDRISLFPVAPEQFLLPREEVWPVSRLEPWEDQAGRVVRYRVVLSPVSTDVLFAAAEARELRGRLRVIAMDETGSLHNQQHGGESVSYDVVSEIGTPTPEELRTASSEVPAEIRQVYLNLPSMDRRVTDLARRITASAGDNYRRTVAVQSYLQDDFGYTLDPSGIDPHDPIPSFLFTVRKGYCEYFASAMTVMLRALGIPARPVNGFQTGTYNKVGGDFVVRARDAHTWVEVYFQGYGWVPFDPTPPDPNLASSGAWNTLGNYLDALDLFWNEWVINFDYAHQFRLAMEVESRSQNYQRMVTLRLDHFEKRGASAAMAVEQWLVAHKLVVTVLMLAALAALAAAENLSSLAELRFAWAWRRRRRSGSLYRRDAVLTYRRFLKAVAKRGFRRLPAQTPREFALALRGTSLGASAVEFTAAYNALRFGGAPVSIDRLRRLLDDIRRA
jgi:protein-glutamine gamma-glutamyltransferase